MLDTFVVTKLQSGELWSRPSESSRCVIVFVHGILGDPIATWQDFPQYLATAPRLSRCDIAQFCYPTRIFGERQTIDTIASILVGWLEQHLARYSHVFILAHSLGGLVVRRAIVRLYGVEGRRLSQFCQKLRSVIFFAVPHRGSWLASRMRHVPILGQNALVHELAQNSPPIEILRSAVSAIRTAAQRTGAAYPETLVVYGTADWIVPQESSSGTDDEQYVLAVPGNHTDITKPQSSDDTVVRLIVNTLDRYLVQTPIHDYMRRIPQLYGDQSIAKEFVALDATTRSGEPVGDLLGHVMGCLRSNSSAFVLLLGEYGSGKSSFAYTLANQMARDVLAQEADSIIPLFLSLGYAKNYDSLLSAVSSFISRYDIDMSEPLLRRYLNQNRDVVFILDGFDEMAGRVSWPDVPQILAKLADLRLSPRVRILLTARTTFFRERLDEEVIPATDRLYLTPFDDTRIEQYLQRNCPNIKAAALRVFETHPSVKELCRTPIQLKLCAAYLSSGKSDSGPLETIDIYNSFIEDNLVRHLETSPEWPLQDRREFVRRLAYRWFSEDIFEVELRDVVRSLDESLPSMNPLPHQQLAMQILNCSFFMRVANKFRLLHLSFAEFFASEVLVAALFEGNLDPWKRRPLYSELFDFMNQMIRRREIASLPIELIVGSGDERAQSNFLATMYRSPIPEMQPCFETLLLRGAHDLVRLVACQGLGLYGAAMPAASLVEAFNNEPNSIVRALIQRLIDHRMRHGSLRDDESELLRNASAASVVLQPCDSESVLRTKAGDHAREAYRRALKLGDRRWTSTAAAVYLLALIGDRTSFEKIREVAGASEVAEVRRALADVQAYIDGSATGGGEAREKR